MTRQAAAVALLLVSVPSFVSAQWLQPTQGEPHRFTGRVVMADGMAIAKATSVELVCNGQIRQRARPYTNGDFTLVLGDPGQEMMDSAVPRDTSSGVPASFGGGNTSALGGGDLGRFDLSGCEVRAALPGYESTGVRLGPRRRLDTTEIGQLVLRPVGGDGVPISANTRAAPEKARRALLNAREHFEKEKPDYPQVVRELEEAIQEYPTFAVAWTLLGRTRLALEDIAGARAAFDNSISADPDYIEPYLELATLDVQQERWRQAATLIELVQELNPYITYANYLSAFSYFHLGEMDLAERWALAVEKAPDLDAYPLTYYILGAVKVHRGDFPAAAFKFRQYLQTKPDAAIAKSVMDVLAEWEQDGLLKP